MLLAVALVLGAAAPGFLSVPTTQAGGVPVEFSRALHEGVVARTPSGYLLSGRSYRAELVEGRLSFTPITLERDARAGEPQLALGLRALVSADGELPLSPSGKPRRPGGSFGQAIVTPYARASLLQTLEARSDGVALELWLLQAPAQAQTLRVEFALEGRLDELRVETSAGQSQTVRLGGPGRVTIGRAVAIDALGVHTELQMELDPGRLSIVLPAELLAGAAFPLRIDPLISSQLAVSGAALSPSAGPDVVFDPFTGHFLAVWERRVSAVTSEIWGARLTAAGNPVGAPFPIDASPAVLCARPRIAADPDSGNYLVAYENEPAGGPGRSVRWSLLDASDLLLASHTFVLQGFSAEERPDVGFVRDPAGDSGFVLAQRRIGVVVPDSWVQVTWIDRSTGAAIDSKTVPTDILRRDGGVAVSQLTEGNPAMLAFHRSEAVTTDVEVFAACVTLSNGQLTVGTPVNLSNNSTEPDGLPDITASINGPAQVVWMHSYPATGLVHILGRDVQANCSQVGVPIGDLTQFAAFAQEPAVVQGRYAGACAGQALTLFASLAPLTGQPGTSLLARRWDPATAGLGAPEGIALGQPGVSSFSTPRAALDSTSVDLPRFLVVYDDNGAGGNPTPNVFGQLYTFDGIPVSVAVTPMAATVCAGDGLVLDAAVSGAGTFTYQWRHDGVPIQGATASTLTLSGLTVAEAGNYDVVVDGTCGSLTSNACSLDVDTALAGVAVAGPASACPADPVLLTAQVQGGSGSLGYQWSKDGNPIAGASAASHAIAALQPSDVGSYTVSVSNACGSVVSAGHTLSLDSAPTGASLGASSPAPCLGDSLTLSAGATSGTQPLAYEFFKDALSLGAPSPTAQLVLGPLTPADAGAYTVVVSNACGLDASPALDVAVGLPPGNVTLVLSANQVCAGVPVTLSVPAATGSPVLTYEWFKDGLSLGPAGTSNSLQIASAQPSNAGSYVARVANACASLDSAPAVLAVTPPPSLYCTAKANSLGCTAVLGWSGSPSASAGSGFPVSFGPVPGAKPGIFLYTKQGAAGTPISNAFGFLCLQPGGLFRTPMVGSGGTNGTCSGTYTLDFNLYFVTQTNDPGLVSGVQVDMQCWYRDPPNPGGANLSNAISFTMCP